MRIPIRARLTAWYVVLLAAVIAGLGAFVVVRLRADLTADFDRSLQSAATEMRAVPLPAGSERVLSVLPADSGAQLVGQSGRLLSTFGRDLPDSPLLTPAERRSVLAGHDVRATAHGPTDTEPFRIFATSVSHGSGRAVLLVASSLEGVDAATHRVLVLLLLGGGAALLAVAAGGWLLARSALRPVARLTSHAARIEVDSLGERVPVPSSSDEIADLAMTLNNMLDRLDRGVGEKRRLVADASHELRTPLAAMRSELDVAIAYDDLDPAARAVLASTRDEVERMSRTVENLLTLARADDGRLELRREPLDLHDVADEVRVALAPVAADTGVAVTSAGAGGIVEADRERVRQIVVNFVDNALKHSPRGGEVRVVTWRANGEECLSVSDDGAGIPGDALEHVFERFYRVDSARARETGGSGLGLAICREIARAHGGRVWAETGQGRGSRFTLALPVA